MNIPLTPLNRRLAIGAAALLLGFVFFREICSRRHVHVLEAIPTQTAISLLFSGPEHFDAPFLNPEAGFQTLEVFQTGRTDAGIALDFLTRSAGLNLPGPGYSLAAGWSLQPSDSLHPVFILDAGEKTEIRRLLAPTAASFKYFESDFKGHTLFTVHLPGRRRLVVAAFRNLILFSRLSYLVEDALVQLHRGDKWWVRRAVSERDAAPAFQMILRTGVFAERCQGRLNDLWKKLPGQLAGKLESLNIYYTNGGWNISGKMPPELPPAILAPPPDDEIFSVLPDNTAILARIGLSRTGMLRHFFQDAGPDRDFRQYLQPWAGKEAAYALLEPLSPEMSKDQFLVFSITDEALARKQLSAYGDHSGLLKQYDYQTFEIRQFLSQTILAPFLDAEKRNFHNPVCAIIGGYAVFAATPSALELWIDKFIVNQTLINVPDFLLLQKRTRTREAGSIYINCNYLPVWLRQVFSKDLNDKNAEDIYEAQKTGFLSFHLRFGKGGRITGALTRQPAGSDASNVSILWKIPLGGKIATMPFLITSNAPGQGGAVLLQDDQYQLYRLSTSGTILWRKQLDKPVISGIHGIDFYKNGGLCYLLNTADAIWMLDDQGQELPGYPLHLQSPATNGVTVLDFDDDRTYSLFLACENGNVYGFDQFGRPLPGWNPQPGAGRVLHNLLHFRTGEKDYLVVLNAEARLSVYNRHGQLHFPALQLDRAFASNPPQADAAPAAARIVCMSSTGRAAVCNLSGKMFALDFGKHADAGATQLVFEDFFGDRQKDYAILSGKTVSGFGYEGASVRERYTLRIPTTPDTLFSVGCCGALGTLNREKKQIYLLDKSGKVRPDFPLAGTTPFRLGRLDGNQSGYLLIVGNGNDVYAYRVP